MVTYILWGPSFALRKDFAVSTGSICTLYRKFQVWNSPFSECFRWWLMRNPYIYIHVYIKNVVVYRMNSTLYQYTVLMRIIIARRLFMVLTIIRSLSYVSNNWPEMAVFTEINGFSNRAMVFGFNPPAHKRCKRCRTFRFEPFLTPSRYRFIKYLVCFNFFSDRYDFSVCLECRFWVESVFCQSIPTVRNRLSGL